MPRAVLAEALEIVQRAGDASSAGRVWQAIALNELIVARFAAAEKGYAESIASCTVPQDAECVAHAQVGLAFALAARKKFDAAIGWYRKAIDAFRALSQAEPEARAQVGLAQALTRKGSHKEAIEAALIARRTALALENDDVLWRAMLVQARALRRLGRMSEALAEANAALATVRRMAGAADARPGGRVPHDALAAYAVTAILQVESGDAAAAFETSEEMRARALRSTLAPNEREIARGLSPADVEEERRLDVALTTLLVQRDRERTLAKPDKERLTRLAAEIADASARRATWRTGVFARLPQLATWRGLDAPATLTDASRVLTAPKAVLVSFVVDEEETLVFALSPKQAEAPTVEVDLFAAVITIERQTLGERVAAALERTALADTAAWRKASAPLFAVLPKEVVARMTAADRVLVCADDVLWRVPFEALPVDGGYLADRASVTYIPSVGALGGSLAVEPARADPAAALVVSHPALEPAAVATLQLTAPAWTIRLESAAEAESAAIRAGAGAGGVMLSGPSATREAVMAALPGARSVHVAAPFRLNAVAPLFSPILLASPQKPDSAADSPARPDEGRVEVRDLFAISTAADVAIFSDPAALSMRDAAAAVPPVGWAWASAGAGTLVLRRWAGDEADASALMSRFHQEMRSGASPSAALAAAQRHVRRPAERRAPLFWAGWLPLSTGGHRATKVTPH